MILELDDSLLHSLHSPPPHSPSPHSPSVLWCSTSPSSNSRCGHGAGSTWALGVGTAFALQWRHNTPLQLKFFQTRIASQAITVAALCGAALISVYDKEEQAEPVRSLSHKRTWR